MRTEQEWQVIEDLALPTLVPLFLDVTKPGSCHSAMNFVEQVMNTTELPLVALVNNAGVMTTSPLEHHDMRDARRVFDVNFFGVLSLLQLALPALRRSGGRVVNVSSMVAVAGDIN